MNKITCIAGAVFAFVLIHAGVSAAKDRTLTYNLYANEGEPRKVIAQTAVQFTDLPDGQTAVSRQKQVKNCMDQDEFILDKNYDLVKWTRVCREDGTDISAERKGNVLVVTGTLNATKIEKEIELGDKALHIYPGYSLSEFAMSGVRKINIWTLRRDKMDKLPMQAINKGEGTIVVNGKEVEVIKVYYSITPKIREGHYNHNYYFRKSDGLFVKNEESGGKVEELVKEE